METVQIVKVQYSRYMTYLYMAVWTEQEMTLFIIHLIHLNFCKCNQHKIFKQVDVVVILAALNSKS